MTATLEMWRRLKLSRLAFVSIYALTLLTWAAGAELIHWPAVQWVWQASPNLMSVIALLPILVLAGAMAARFADFGGSAWIGGGLVFLALVLIPVGGYLIGNWIFVAKNTDSETRADDLFFLSLYLGFGVFLLVAFVAALKSGNKVPGPRSQNDPPPEHHGMAAKVEP